MTEKEWLASDDPEEMLHCLIAQSVPGNVGGLVRRPSDRKLRLFAAACCREMWSLLKDDRSRRAVEVSEQLADGLAPVGVVTEVGQPAWLVVSSWDGDGGEPLLLARQAAWCVAPIALRAADGAVEFGRDGSPVPYAVQVALLRDIVGDLFRPPWMAVFSYPPSGSALKGRRRWFLRSWLTPNVLSIARAAYDERDFSRLPILADALEDANCSDPAVLDHLRGPGPHARGCWVLDLLLGRD